MKKSFVAVVFALVLASSAARLVAQDISTCQASFNGGELVIRNTHIEGRWQVMNGVLRATSLRDLKTGIEWLAESSSTPAHGGRGAGKRDQPLVFSAKRSSSSAIEQQSLVVELSAQAAAKTGYRFRIFPGANGISVQRIGAAQQGDGLAQPISIAKPSGIEVDAKSAIGNSAVAADTLEELNLTPQQLKLTQVNFFDQTDAHNELVSERAWLLHPSESLRLQGNLFTLENPLTGNGLIFLKEAPLPHARPGKSDADVEYHAKQYRIALLGRGPGPSGSGYRFTTLTYSGGRTGVTRALQDYQRRIRPYVPGRDGMFLSNTWGDRSRDARIQDAFLRQEVEAAARLGVDVVQIDDGWQQGRTSNSAQKGGVWNGFWASDPGFWNVNRQRFPAGLSPVIDLARRKGMGFGLWFSPDSSNEFSNWERDAERLLELHRTAGVNYFKIDGVKAITELGEERLQMLFNRVLSKSGGRVVIDLDVTAETRPGYFGAMSVGPIFVENRYTDFHSYWPHQTLRNLWELAQYVDPLRLRMEFLNNTRNTHLYAGDPLAPAAYSPACLFATTMMANPLGWFEVSNLPRQFFDQVAPLVAAWKRERAAMQAGHIFPIGAAPDGFAWTGFASVSDNNREGYVLVFRERNTAAAWSLESPVFASGEYKLELLAGEGSGTLRNRKLAITIPGQLGFAWFRVRQGRP